MLLGVYACWPLADQPSAEQVAWVEATERLIKLGWGRAGSPVQQFFTSTLAASGLASPAAQAQTFAFQSSGTAQVIEAIDPNGPVLRFVTQTEGSGGFGVTGYLSTAIVNMATGAGSGTNRFAARATATSCAERSPSRPRRATARRGLLLGGLGAAAAGAARRQRG